MLLQAHAYQEPFATMPVRLPAPWLCMTSIHPLANLAGYLQLMHQHSHLYLVVLADTPSKVFAVSKN